MRELLFFLRGKKIEYLDLRDFDLWCDMNRSLQLKVKKMEEEREQSLKEESSDDGQKPDLEDVKEERSQNDNNSGADGKPEESTGKAGSSEESDRENRSFNESNSTENREIGVKNEPEPVETGEFRPVQEAKPVSEEDSYNGSSSDRHEEKKISRESGESKEETKENSDVQSTATLTKKKRQRGGDGGRSCGDAVETGSPAVGLSKGEGAAKSEPLIEFLDIIRSHKRGSMFKRRLDSQVMILYFAFSNWLAYNHLVIGFWPFVPL